ncbi:RING/FYVE/PHD zinc finger superfamily protein [Arabidopsis thaliana]|uniref:RING/FYVE/PHD zinc finger superfamily protein n=1 Tax=Arabidopsis thaliana TaxID=3702 RepID=F4ISG1_ARATH|nr:RING/FYVE/PHD zinc finger superfamily protein [Arabidopsis thaliana]NP_179516.2 RING/FYVE/PHD zinc finger superfamily protein [Arabidopsis thaliana]AEC06861.1 RING/FYVE/PHD zinc finger superfamily protein [Arabidopsis thaliana]ANM62723.1 RING/FYVE/PHD zinc finger superfamily protein [Arabidopsis thaliana]|eukprot:NP_001324862.1 RING/FYVE/PHD zinc finger superfamily protein [Arabidopsis thaliana]
MLVESSFSSSVETSLLNVSEYQDPFAAYDWTSLAESYQMIHKVPEQSQVSFLKNVPVTDTMNLDESKHPKHQESCSEKSVMHKVSGKALTSLVYRRRKRTLIPGGTEEHNLGKIRKQDDSLDDSIVSLYNPEESTKRKNRFNNCLVYSRKKRRGESSCTFTGETTIRGDGLDDAFVSEHDCGETRRRGNRSDDCLVYSRKKGRVKFNSCSFSKHVTGRTKISYDQADSSACSQMGQIVKADSSLTRPKPGEIKKSGHQLVYSQRKQLVKSNGSFTESHVGKTKRNGDRSEVLLTYSRRKKSGKSIGVRVNGFLVYTRKKLKFRGPFARRDLSETKKNGDQRSTVSSRELLDDTQVTEVTCSSDGTNDSCSSLKSSSEVNSTSSKSREDDCYSSDSGVSETDTDGSSSPFRQCKHCDKPGTVEKMLICDECEEAYHTRCCGVQMKDVAEIDEWLCPSCLKNQSSKTKTKGRISHERKWRVTVPFVIGIRIGKMFQADVPDWSGPTMSDTSFVGEPLEIGQSEYMHDLKKAKNSKKQCSAVNWLQCREEDTNGVICGKWRRAPRSEVQTKDWECFCCFSWDPSRADCAVPQELETSEILKQLKYIKMLRPRSDAKKRKLGPKGRSRSHIKGKS